MSDKDIFEGETVKKEKNMQQNSETPEKVVFDEENKAQILKDLTDKALLSGKKALSYTEISDRIGNIELDKDQMEEIYEVLMSQGIEVVLESEPDEIDLMELEKEEVDDP